MFSDSYMIISKHYQAYLKSRLKPKIAFQTAFLSIAWIFCFCLSRHWLKRCKTYQMTLPPDRGISQSIVRIVA